MDEKTKNNGVKLLVGGVEVTKEHVEQAIRDYESKINSPEYQQEIEEFLEFSSAEEKVIHFQYYRLTTPPQTIFKINMDNFLSYRLDENRKCWIEFSEFIEKFEKGEVAADPIIFKDEYPIFDAVDQSNIITK